MPALIQFVIVNFTIGAALGAGIAMWLVAAQVGPGAVVAASHNAQFAAWLFAYAMGASFGIGYLATALAWAHNS